MRYGHGAQVLVNYDVASVLHWGTFWVCSPVFRKQFVWAQATLCLGATLAIGALVDALGVPLRLEALSGLTLITNYFSALVGFSFGYYVFSEVPPRDDVAHQDLAASQRPE